VSLDIDTLLMQSFVDDSEGCYFRHQVMSAP